MLDLITELLVLFEELKFWKRSKKQGNGVSKIRKFRGNLERPIIFILLIGAILYIAARFVVPIIATTRINTITHNRIREIQSILEKEWRDTGQYPTELKSIIRNRPLRKNIIIDSWGNEFHYKLNRTGLSYKLRSTGKDGVLNTKDDIIPNSRLVH